MTDTWKPVKLPSGNDYVAAEKIEDKWYQLVHLSPETDPIARAICEKLGIDWESIQKEKDA